MMEYELGPDLEAASYSEMGSLLHSLHDEQTRNSVLQGENETLRDMVNNLAAENERLRELMGHDQERIGELEEQRNVLRMTK